MVAKGVYFLKIKSDQGNTNRKIIKSKVMNLQVFFALQHFSIFIKTLKISVAKS
jgi:hypothetical protein